MKKTKQFIENFTQRVKISIAALETYSALTSEQKKERLDEMVTKFVQETIDSIGLNFVLKLIVKKLLIENIPLITQAAFDLIKARVRGITEG